MVVWCHVLHILQTSCKPSGRFPRENLIFLEFDSFPRWDYTFACPLSPVLDFPWPPSWAHDVTRNYVVVWHHVLQILETSSKPSDQFPKDINFLIFLEFDHFPWWNDTFGLSLIFCVQFSFTTMCSHIISTCDVTHSHVACDVIYYRSCKHHASPQINFLEKNFQFPNFLGIWQFS